ncbi:MAG TPA: hypothetical protein VJI46_06670 [Candidatus Nanoarchaeia archaeon]|nr:hypothetical protein [Candidatus Nanoarchaeia archaeon]
MHGKNGLACSLTLVLLGIIFLLRDVGFISLGNVSEWSILLIVFGLGGLWVYKTCCMPCCNPEPQRKGKR